MHFGSISGVQPHCTYQVWCFANDKPELGVTDVVAPYGPSHDDDAPCRVFNDQWRHKMRKWSDFNPFTIADILTSGFFFRVHTGTRTTMTYLAQWRRGQLELGGGLSTKRNHWQTTISNVNFEFEIQIQIKSQGLPILEPSSVSLTGFWHVTLVS